MSSCPSHLRLQLSPQSLEHLLHGKIYFNFFPLRCINKNLEIRCCNLYKHNFPVSYFETFNKFHGCIWWTIISLLCFLPVLVCPNRARSFAESIDPYQMGSSKVLLKVSIPIRWSHQKSYWKCLPQLNLKSRRKYSPLN